MSGETVRAGSARLENLLPQGVVEVEVESRTMVSTILLAVAASAKAAEVSGGMSIISSELITAIFTGMAAVLGVIWQKSRNDKKLAEKDEEIKRIKAELPQPLAVEQSNYQATMKANAKDHENLFGRIAKLEQSQAALAAKVDAKFDSISEQLRETKDMVRQLFERICKGKK